jgi:integrase
VYDNQMHENTIVAYTANATRITNQVVERFGSATPDTYFRYLMEKSEELCTNTIRIYKLSVCFGLTQAGREEDADALRGMFDEVENPARGRKLKLVRRVPNNIFQRTVANLRESKSKTAQQAADLLVATAITGLRPTEWASAQIVGRTLTIKNAKHSELRGNGEERELELLDTLTPGERQAIENTMLLIRDKGYKTVRPNLSVCFKKALGRAIRELGESRWFMRLRLYDLRHQFSADAKHEWGIGTGMVAAAMGHSVEETAVEHYGRRKHGGGGMKVRPSKDSIARVRRLYETNPEPPAPIAPHHPIAGDKKIKLSFG